MSTPKVSAISPLVDDLELLVCVILISIDVEAVDKRRKLGLT